MTALDTGLTIAAILGWLLLAVALVKVVEKRDEADQLRDDYEAECADHAKTAGGRRMARDHARRVTTLNNVYVRTLTRVIGERDAALANLEMVLNNKDVASVIDMTTPKLRAAL